MDPSNGEDYQVYDGMDYSGTPITPPVAVVQANNAAITMVHTPEYMSPTTVHSPTSLMNNEPTSDGINGQHQYDIDSLHQRLQQESSPSADTVQQIIQIVTTSPLAGYCIFIHIIPITKFKQPKDLQANRLERSC